MPTIIDPVIRLLVDIGLVDVILPFVLVFTIVFAVLEQTKVLGEKRRNANVVVAVICGFLVLASADLLGAINRISAFLSVVLLTGLLVMMLLGLVGVQSLEKSKPLMYVLFAILFFGTLYVLGAFELVSRRSLLDYFLPAVLVFAIFVLLVWSVLRVLPGKTKDVTKTKDTKNKGAAKSAKPESSGKEAKVPVEQIISAVVESLPPKEKAEVKEVDAIVAKLEAEQREPTESEQKKIARANEIIANELRRKGLVK